MIIALTGFGLLWSSLPSQENKKKSDDENKLADQ
jgi:hypothetical protein